MDACQAPNEISIRDFDVVQPMLGPAGLSKGPGQYRPSQRLDRLNICSLTPGMTGRNLHQSTLPLIAIRDPVEHGQRRKPWSRAFSTAALKEYQPTVRKRAAQLLERLRKESGTVDLAQWISFFA